MPDVQLPPVGHAFPHELQLWASVCSSTHIPGVPPQTTSPAGQWHEPDVHDAPAAQARVHDPQCCASVSSSTQAGGHVFGNGAAHWQLPVTHASFASGHRFPQFPQFLGSVCLSTQAFPHGSGNAPAHWQLPATHDSFVSGQTFPQVPQFVGSVWRCLQRGFTPAQSDPPSHWQAPPAQVPNPHSIAHAAQFMGSVWNVAASTHWPRHATCPAPGQTHVPPTQDAPMGQRTPQAPHASVLVCRSRQAPQSVWPEGHACFAGQPAVAIASPSRMTEGRRIRP